MRTEVRELGDGRVLMYGKIYDRDTVEAGIGRKIAKTRIKVLGPNESLDLDQMEEPIAIDISKPFIKIGNKISTDIKEIKRLCSDMDTDPVAFEKEAVEFQENQHQLSLI